MKKLGTILRLYVNVVRIGRNANNTAAGLAIGECLQKLGLMERMVQHLKADPASASLIQSRKLLSGIDLHQLNRLPQGSVGRVYSDSMLANNLKPDFFKVLPIENDALYCMMRTRQTHDLWHVLTGFKTSVPGELGLQAFMFSQTKNMLPALLIGGRLFLKTVFDPEEALAVMESVVRGWQMGKKAQCVFGIDWEAHWATPVEELRKQYGIVVGD